MPEDYRIEEREGILAGIDLDNDIVQISCYHTAMEEPQTIGPYVGVEKFDIPLCLYTVNPSNQWFYGESARDYQGTSEGVYIDDIWQGCLLEKEIMIQEQTYSYAALMVVFLKKVLKLGCQLGRGSNITGVAFTVQELDDKKIAVLQEIARSLPVSAKSIFFQDYKESFAYFVMNQKRELWNREVFLFYFTGKQFWGYQLVVNQKTEPYEVLIEQVLQEQVPKSEESAGQMDTWFGEQIEKLFGRRLISAVYLIGNGFDSGWMKNSLRLLCHGRRVFQGKNLFTKGACYACMELLGWKKRSGFYKGGHALACQIRIPVMVKNHQQYIYAARGGEPWYMAGICMECILDDCNEVQLEVLCPGKDAEVISLATEHLPKRPNLATKLQINVELLSSSRGQLTVKDMGLGELYESSGLEWKKEFSL